MNAKRIPAETFPVGKFIQDELDARKWSHADLAARSLSLSPDEVTAIVAGARRLLAKDAVAIGRAFGTGPEVWLKLQRTGLRK